MAPGVAILATMIPKEGAGSVPVGKKPSGYAIRSGTSMACPHVSGAAAFIQSVHQGWSSSMIKSALMTTGTFELLKVLVIELTNHFIVGKMLIWGVYQTFCSEV